MPRSSRPSRVPVGERPPAVQPALQQLLPAEGVTEAAAPAEQTAEDAAEAPRRRSASSRRSRTSPSRARRFADANPSFDAYPLSRSGHRRSAGRAHGCWPARPRRCTGSATGAAPGGLGTGSCARTRSASALFTTWPSRTRWAGVARQLESWRRYAETLYTMTSSRQPHPHASARAEFHGDAGGADGPDGVGERSCSRPQDRRDDARHVPQQPETGAAVRGHKLLEVLDAKLAFTSPPLILGVSRSEGEELRESASRAARVRRRSCGSVPERVAARSRSSAAA